MHISYPSVAQSYDWLLFPTDAGLAQFIDELPLHPVPELQAAKTAFLSSCGNGKPGSNCFTKVQMDNAANASLQHYFKTHKDEIEGWYNIISPAGRSIATLRSELKVLCDKNWQQVHAR